MPVVLDNVHRTTINSIKKTTGTLSIGNRLDHFLARIGFNRAGHRVEPGLYALGNPGKESPVFVTANYTLSFDALRSSLKDVDAYILVLDTKGINVWCAAGKGTFGTKELIRRINATGLAGVVSHRRLILPQLGAPGVASYAVEDETGFKVEYGPIRADDLPDYLKEHKATPDMRRVTFPLKERVALIPVELTGVLMPLLVGTLLIYVLFGFLSAVAALTAVLAGTVLFPMLLPYIPVKDFSIKGIILGLLVSLPFAYLMFIETPGAIWFKALAALMYPLVMAPVTAFLSLNFTGSTPFTSRTGVKKEIFTYVMPMALSLAGGIVLFILMVILTVLGVA